VNSLQVSFLLGHDKAESTAKAKAKSTATKPRNETGLQQGKKGKKGGWEASEFWKS
jgi:hypothetical protein